MAGNAAEPYWETVIRKVREQDALAAETTSTLRDEIVAASVALLSVKDATYTSWSVAWRRLQTAVELYRGVQS